jgi:hypothetical protein
MKRYAVHFKNKSTQNFVAFGYTCKDGKYFFHKQADKTDFESFAEESEVMGVDCLGDEDDFNPVAVFG